MSATQDWIDEFVRYVRIRGFDRKAVFRFINDTLNGKAIDHTDMKQAAVLLGALLEGAKHGDNVGAEFRRLLGVRKLRSKKFDPKNAPIDTPEWGIVANYVQGKIRHVDAVKQLQELRPATVRQCEAWIRTMKPRVQKTVAFLDALRAEAENTEKKRG